MSQQDLNADVMLSSYNNGQFFMESDQGRQGIPNQSFQSFDKIGNSLFSQNALDDISIGYSSLGMGASGYFQGQPGGPNSLAEDPIQR